jgi:hypothetical protein
MRATLRNLCLVSKLMHRYAEPALYSCIIIRSNKRQDKLQLYAFAEGLTSKPQLLHHLKYFQFSYIDFEMESGPRSCGDTTMPSDPECRTCKSIGREDATTPPALETALFNLMTIDIFEELSLRREDDPKEDLIIMSLLALILSRSSNLQHLCISTSLYYPPYGVYDILDIFGYKHIHPQNFAKLRVLCFTMLFVDDSTLWDTPSAQAFTAVMFRGSH